MNDNHVFQSNNLQEEKEIQLHSAHHRLSCENISRDTTFKPGRAKLGLRHDRISLLVKCHYLEEKISLLPGFTNLRYRYNASLKHLNFR